MDNKTIVNIAFGAAIIAAVSWLVKELLDAAKKRLTRDTTREKVKTIFSKSRRTIAVDVVLTLYTSAVLIWFIHGSVVVTGFAVVEIVLLVVFILCYILKLIWDIVALRFKRE